MTQFTIEFEHSICFPSFLPYLNSLVEQVIDLALCFQPESPPGDGPSQPPADTVVMLTQHGSQARV